MIFVFVIFALNISCVGNNDVIVAIHNESRKEFINNFFLHKGYNVKIIDNGNYLKLKNTTLNMWLEIASILKLEMDTISNNIANAHTTQSENGEPFRRKTLIFTVENGVEIITDPSIEKHFVYDPSHPDAIGGGERQGYVEYPNVDMVIEMIHMAEVNTFFESVSHYLRNKYKNVIF
jgi:flagellar basal-body rod protein FlgC